MTTATLGQALQRYTIARHWIDGQWHDAVRHKDCLEPVTGEVIGRYTLAGEDGAREAVAAAPHLKHKVESRCRSKHEGDPT